MVYKRNSNSYSLFRRVLESIEDRVDGMSQEMSSDHKCSEGVEQITWKVVKSPSIGLFKLEVRPAFVRNWVSVLSPQREALTTDMRCSF